MCISLNETQSQVKFLGERKQDVEPLWGLGGVHNTMKLGPHFWSPPFLLHKGFVVFLDKLGSITCCENLLGNLVIPALQGRGNVFLLCVFRKVGR